MTMVVDDEAVERMAIGVAEYMEDTAKLRAQLAEATARAENERALREEAEARADMCHANHAGAMARLREEAMDARSALNTANIALEQAIRNRDAATARAERAERERDLAAENMDAFLKDAGDAMDRAIAAGVERDEARAQLAEAKAHRDHDEKMIVRLHDRVRVAEERAEQAETLCTERAEWIDMLICQLRDMQVRAEQAESRLLSDETVRRIRWWAAFRRDSFGAVAVDNAVLAELDAKYPSDGGSDG